MTQVRRGALFVCAAALVGCGGGTETATSGGTGTGETVKKAVSAPHAVYGPLEHGAEFASWTKVNSTQVMSKTHGKRFVDTHVNDVGLEAYKDDDADIPVGTVIVKPSWETVDGVATEVSGPTFVMKRVAGADGGDATWWYALHWEKVPDKWQKAMGGSQAYWRTPSKKVGYCSECHDNFPRELGGVPKEHRAY